MAAAGELKLPETDDYTFGDWLDSTIALQRAAFGHDPAEWVEDGRVTEHGADRFIRAGAWPAVCEIVEMADEVGWKPWATGRQVNRGAVIREAVDVMHFLANCLRAVECTGEELTAEYKHKQRVNLRRQQEGYDGVADKCPSCKRDRAEARPYVFENKNALGQTVGSPFRQMRCPCGYVWEAGPS